MTARIIADFSAQTLQARREWYDTFKVLKGKKMQTRILYWRRQWHPTPVLLPGKSHGQRSLVGCSPWGRREPDMTERLHFDFSLSCIGEGNGNTPVFLPGETQGWRSLVGCCLWGRTELDMTEVTQQQQQHTLASFVKYKVSICAWVYFWAFYFVPLVYISVFVPVPYCLDDCSFVV